MSPLRRIGTRLYLGLALLGTQALAAEGPAALEVPSTQFRLANGLEVILHEDHSLPLVAVNLWYHVGSAREKPGRTGLAHLFEHLMFEGSENVPEGAFDRWLEAAGGDNNGSTNEDRTNYFEQLPANALELALFLESDRMGYLLSTMSPEKVNGQRQVVKNERRQSYENRPYGMAGLLLEENLFPSQHPYHRPVIGSMQDLDAASYQDVVEFFRLYYQPGNASLVIAGDIDRTMARQLVEKWFAGIPAGRPIPPLVVAPPARPVGEKRLLLEDRVELPRLYLGWLSPAVLAPGDAELDLVASLLSQGRNSRLYKRLVYELTIAQDVVAYQDSKRLASNFVIQVTARSGHSLGELLTVIDEELGKLRAAPPSAREVERAVNQYESGFLASLERLQSKANQLNGYFFGTGNPDYFNEDLSRYRALSPSDVEAAAERYLTTDRVLLSVVPRGKKELALSGNQP